MTFEYTVKAECYNNMMPGGSTDRKPYIIINITPSDSLFDENIKLTKVNAFDGNQTWFTSEFDRMDFMGKGLPIYTNTAREFSSDFETFFSMIVYFETESGKQIIQRVDDIPIIRVE